MEEPKNKRELTAAEKARIERNRLKAMQLRESKIAVSKESECGGKMIKVDGHKFKDTNGGFLLDEVDHTVDEEERAAKIQKLAEEDAMEVPVSYLTCNECSEEFADSYLYKNFDFSCCDKCKDLDEKHELITKTDAKNEFLLKDCDFDKREPPLKFISRKNPHKSTWAEMKLYLKSQVKARAMEVYESEKKIEDERKIREEKREISKVKKYNKQLSTLRKNVRATLYDKTYKPHEHEYGKSTYNEETDEYSHACKTCGFVETYEEL
ncbi:unnamed protein product [Chironomus riparius]|uniref:XPA C-terminal domain-containing protein n=1 Tax=Chironomus riparius TaxID=315576 RepID=A0A9N9WQB4_9DIPT|nr:unnamed protein product [Chironomus riparius]